MIDPLRPRIAVTMGDPAGVGPEICLRLLAEPSVSRHCVPIVFGDVGVLRRVADELKIAFDATVVTASAWRDGFPAVVTPTVVDFAALDAELVRPGEVDASCGEAAFRYVVASIDAGLRGEVEAVATAPLNKAALHAHVAEDDRNAMPGHARLRQ